MHEVFETPEGKKLKSIYDDLSINVTKIYDRPLLHMGIDLLFHSALSFNFRDSKVQRGWLDILVIGDTRTGKTDVAKELINHYRVGELITGENTSKAGLIGGLTQIGSNWMISWGKIPINDRRLVILDEASGMAESLMGDLSGIRSSGIAEVVKIRSERTFARVRTAWLSNPRGSRGINSYTYPVYAAKDLIQRPEDIARFDYCLVSKTHDVPLSIINAKEHPKIKHIYTREACNQLILWVWSRLPDQFKFTNQAEESILDYATDFGGKYSSDIPFVEPNEVRITIARVAVAIAGRLFSTKDGITVDINVSHVESAVKFLEASYEQLGYDKYSALKQKEQTIREDGGVDRQLEIYGEDFVSGLLEANLITVEDIMDLTAETYDAARMIITLLVKSRCLKRLQKMGYIKTPSFIKMLNNLKPCQVDMEDI